MSIEDRVAALETRLRAAEDKLEILNLLNSYGPAVDSGDGETAAGLFVPGGGYNLGGGINGGTSEGIRLEAPDQLFAMWRNEEHIRRVNTGSSHLTATPKIAVNGDEATAVGYSYVVQRDGEHWFVWRAAINEWKLVRTPEGWRIAERYNRTLDGSPESHEVMRRAAGL